MKIKRTGLHATARVKMEEDGKPLFTDSKYHISWKRAIAYSDGRSQLTVIVLKDIVMIEALAKAYCSRHFDSLSY